MSVRSNIFPLGAAIREADDYPRPMGVHMASDARIIADAVQAQIKAMHAQTDPRRFIVFNDPQQTLGSITQIINALGQIGCRFDAPIWIRDEAGTVTGLKFWESRRPAA